MATSHYCEGKWREGSVASCDRHTKLSKTQTNVYRGVGEPGGRAKAPKPAESKAPQKSTKPDKPASSAGSSSTDG